MQVKSKDYVFNNQKLPAVSASASKDSLGRTHITLTNIDSKNAQDIAVNIKGVTYKTLTGRILTSAKLQDYNSFQDPNKIKPVAFNGASIKGNTLSVKMPPFSVVVLELK
jgi:alpha-L-arabinofuranosidase